MAASIRGYYEVADWFTEGDPNNVTGVAWEDGDVIVVIAGDEDGEGDVWAPTNANLTFTQREHEATGSECVIGVWTTTATSTETGQTITGGSSWGFHSNGRGVWVIGGADAYEQSAQNRTEDDIELTSVLSGSVVIYGLFDWNAGLSPRTQGTATGTPTKRFDDDDGASYGVWGGDWVGVDAGTDRFGITSYAGIKACHAAVEISAAETGPTTHQGAAHVTVDVEAQATPPSTPGVGVGDVFIVHQSTVRSGEDYTTEHDSGSAATPTAEQGVWSGQWTTPELTLPAAGQYLFGYSEWAESTGTQRSGAFSQFSVNTGGGHALVGLKGSTSWPYLRNTQGATEGSVHGVYLDTLGSGDDVKVRSGTVLNGSNRIGEYNHGATDLGGLWAVDLGTDQDYLYASSTTPDTLAGRYGTGVRPINLGTPEALSSGTWVQLSFSATDDSSGTTVTRSTNDFTVAANSTVLVNCKVQTSDLPDARRAPIIQAEVDGSPYCYTGFYHRDTANLTQAVADLSFLVTTGGSSQTVKFFAAVDMEPATLDIDIDAKSCRFVDLTGQDHVILGKTDADITDIDDTWRNPTFPTGDEIADTGGSLSHGATNTSRIDNDAGEEITVLAGYTMFWDRSAGSNSTRVVPGSSLYLNGSQLNYAVSSEFSRGSQSSLDTWVAGYSYMAPIVIPSGQYVEVGYQDLALQGTGNDMVLNATDGAAIQFWAIRIDDLGAGGPTTHQTAAHFTTDVEATADGIREVSGAADSTIDIEAQAAPTLDAGGTTHQTAAHITVDVEAQADGIREVVAAADSTVDVDAQAAPTHTPAGPATVPLFIAPMRDWTDGDYLKDEADITSVTGGSNSAYLTAESAGHTDTLGSHLGPNGHVDCSGTMSNWEAAIFDTAVESDLVCDVALTPDYQDYNTIGFVFRNSSATTFTDCYYLTLEQGGVGSGTMELWERSSSSDTSLGSWGYSVSESSIFWVRVEIEGENINVLVDQDTAGGKSGTYTNRISVTDSTHATGNYVGLYAQRGVAAAGGEPVIGLARFWTYGTAPIVSYHETVNWTETGTSNGIGSSDVDWVEGDVVVVAGAGGDASAIDLIGPDNVNLSFTQWVDVDAGTAGDCVVGIWDVQAPSTIYGTSLTYTKTAGAEPFGASCWVIAGSTGTERGYTGSRAEEAMTMGTQDLGSTVIAIVADDDGGSGFTGITNSGTLTERVDTGDATSLGVWVGDWAGVDAEAGSWGITDYSGLTNVTQGASEYPPDTTVGPPPDEAHFTTDIEAQAAGTRTVSASADATIDVEAQADPTLNVGGTTHQTAAHITVDVEGAADGIRTVSAGADAYVDVEAQAVVSPFVGGSADTTVNVAALADGVRTVSASADATIDAEVQGLGRITGTQAARFAVDVEAQAAGTAYLPTVEVWVQAVPTIVPPALQTAAHISVDVESTADGIRTVPAQADVTVDVDGQADGRITGTQAADFEIDVDAQAAGTRTVSGAADATIDIETQADGIRAVSAGADSTVAVEAQADGRLTGTQAADFSITVAGQADGTIHLPTVEVWVQAVPTVVPPVLQTSAHFTTDVEAQADGVRTVPAQADATVTVEAQAAGSLSEATWTGSGEFTLDVEMLASPTLVHAVWGNSADSAIDVGILAAGSLYRGGSADLEVEVEGSAVSSIHRPASAAATVTVSMATRGGLSGTNRGHFDAATLQVSANPTVGRAGAADVTVAVEAQASPTLIEAGAADVALSVEAQASPTLIEAAWEGTAHFALSVEAQADPTLIGATHQTSAHFTVDVEAQAGGEIIGGETHQTAARFAVDVEAQAVPTLSHQVSIPADMDVEIDGTASGTFTWAGTADTSTAVGMGATPSVRWAASAASTVRLTMRTDGIIPHVYFGASNFGVDVEGQTTSRVHRPARGNMGLDVSAHGTSTLRFPPRGHFTVDVEMGSIGTGSSTPPQLTISRLGIADRWRFSQASTRWKTGRASTQWDSDLKGSPP